MKIDTSFKIFKFSRLVPLGIAIAAILVTQPIRAGVVPMSEIVLTEHSPTSLTATLNGSASGITVLNTDQDQWTVTFPTTISFNNGLNNLPAGWGEPEATESNLIYNVISSPSLNNQLFVVSDFSPPKFFLHSSNGNGLAIFPLGIDSSGIAPVDVSVTFFDNGDVPETGSTLGLLFVSVTALFGLNRQRQVRSA